MYSGIGCNQDKEINKTEWLTKEVPYGKKTTLKLSDGTQIKLNSGSMLYFPKVFKKDSSRIVFLEGEAFFDVVKDTTRPFIIHSSSITTTVMGTSFNIKAYQNEEDIVVSVVTGLVEVIDNVDKQSVYLNPKEQVVYNNAKKGLKKRSFESSEVSWKEGKLIFEGADLKEIIKQLERWYGVKFIVQNPRLLSKRGYTETFENASLKMIMETISFAGGFQFSITNNKVTIK